MGDAQFRSFTKITRHFKILKSLLLFLLIWCLKLVIIYIVYSIVHFSVINYNNEQFEKQAFINPNLLHWGYKEVNTLIKV